MLVNNVNNYNIGTAERVFFFFKVLKSVYIRIYTTCVQLTANKNKQNQIYQFFWKMY